MSKKPGNPNWGKNPQTATTNRPEVRMALIQIRIEASLLTELKKIENWQEALRNSIADLVEKEGLEIPAHLRGIVY